MRLCLFAGSSNRGLATKVAETLGTHVSDATIRRFADGEVFVEIEENVRGKDVYILQSTCPPVNDHIMELLIMIDALKRASTNSITAVIPYYGYSRQDRKVAPRTPISAKLVADLLTAAGCSRVVGMDLHAGQIQGFFNIPFDNLYARPVILDHLKSLFSKTDDLVFVAPDAGGVERARAFAKRINDAGVAMIDKRRTGPNVAKAMHLIGSVEGKIAIILDDMIDTAGTLVEAAETVKKNGATKIYACATHAVLSDPATDRIKNSCLQQVIITDTIPLSPAAQQVDKIHVLSSAGILAEAIRRIHSYESVSSLFT
ncbi:MAG TPA: ribose-phosphate pyrophosphokinase [Oligoflexia bacterium]|nr:ribose-phosphate pyrophosphokinase [Oligoflexia bacterium]